MNLNYIEEDFIKINTIIKIRTYNFNCDMIVLRIGESLVDLYSIF